MTPVRLTKLGHSCVRVEVGERRVVVDPGAWSDPAALDGAAAVLVTHQHPDHLDAARLRAALDANAALEVWAPADVVAALGVEGPAATRVHAVGPGEEFEAAGVPVQVLGEWHATIHPDIPRLANLGYLLAGRVLHPGDALLVPEGGVEVLLVPVSAPWLRLADVIDYVRAVAPATALPVHDKIYSAAGLAIVGRQLGPDGVGLGPTVYRPWTDGETVTLD